MASARRAVVLAALVAACSRAGPPAPFALRDEIGREVRLAGKSAFRVVSLAPNVTEILFAIGAGDRLVGVDVYSDWPPAASRLPRVGSDLEPSLETIARLRPDLVVTATTANPEQAVLAIERLGVPVYVTKTEGLSD